MFHPTLQKNFQHLSLEHKGIFFAHLATVLFCFFPWFTATPSYEESFYHTAFGGDWFLIGASVFGISFVITVCFLDELLESHRFFKFHRQEKLLLLCSGEQLIFLVFIWSLLITENRSFQISHIGFGFFLVLFAQIIGFVAVYLLYKK